MKLEMIALLFAALPQDNDADKLFKAMCAKIDKAKTIQIIFEADMDQGGDDRRATFKGTVLLGEGNQFRLDARGEFQKKEYSAVSVSDGKMSRSTLADGKFNDTETPKAFRATLNEWIKCVGYVGGSFLNVVGLKGQGEVKAEELFKMSEFKLGKKQRLGDKEVLALEYKVQCSTVTGIVPGSAVMYLDPKTHLPLRHVVTVEAVNRRIVITQNNTSFRIDEKIDAKLFELPK